jgi:uncharacterized glyoxalase superfamily protein PhnB
MKMTPLLFMNAIEPSLPFWVERLGFEKTAEVPHEDRLGFVILQKGEVELMLQTRASVAADLPSLVPLTQCSVGLFVEVEDFPDLLRRVEGFEVLVPVRDTFYGMREIVVREPGGNAVAFAARLG